MKNQRHFSLLILIICSLAFSNLAFAAYQIREEKPKVSKEKGKTHAGSHPGGWLSARPTPIPSPDYRYR